MSIDRSLKVKNALTRHRNVLTRAERIAKLQDEERWIEGSSVFGLPKVAHRKSHAGRKEKEGAVTEAVAVGEMAVGETAAAAGAAAAPKAGGKAAPTGKAATPAGKAASAAKAAKAEEKPKGKGQKEKG